MTVGLFGKLPSKRDFVTHRVPAAVLDPWSAWVEACLAHWRADGRVGGRDWRQAYLEAALWRFDLAAGILGPDPVLGVWCPSADSKGRLYPLAVLAIPEPSGQPPVQWFEAAEELCLSALDEELEDRFVENAVGDLGAPSPSAGSGGRAAVWSTVGGEGIRAANYACEAGLPDPRAAVTLITGTAEAPCWSEV